MNVLFITNVPSPYRVDFFNELGKHCDLTVLFEKSTSDERDKSWKEYSFKNFRGIILKSISINTDTALSFNFLHYVKEKKYDHIIISNISSPTGIFTISYMILKGIKYHIEIDGAIVKNKENSIKKFLKKLMIKNSDLCFSTSNEGDCYFLKYGANKNNIFRYPFTSFFEKEILDICKTSVEKSAMKKELGVYEDVAILSVGQFIYRKGFDVLINSCQYIAKNVGIYIIGGKPTEEYINLKKELNLSNLHFLGFKTKSELQKYYEMADLFVLPTREDIWGLVINEAMSYGLPIITTKKCIAGTELVKNDINGYLVDVDSSEQLSTAINHILSDNNLLVNMGEQSLKIIKDYTIESMAARHMEILEKR